MIRSLKNRMLQALAVAAVSLVLGTVGGYMVARVITVRIAESKLEQYAARLIADGEASSAELRTVLSAVSASQSPPCSDAELRYFRGLIFESEFVKDAGRMRDGKIECSAALGRQHAARLELEPDFTQQDGTAIYKSLGPYRNSDLTTLALESGGAYIVFTPLTRMHLEPAPMHFTETAKDAPSQRAGLLLGDPAPDRYATLTTDGIFPMGSNLYVTRCSIRFFNCATAYTSIPEIVAANRTKFGGCILLCGLVATVFGILCSLLYRRNKSLEQQLRRAIFNDKLRVVYQPIVLLENRLIVGAEALVRWNDEEGVPVGPDVFVKMAEERGFVGSITKLVLRHVLRDFGPILCDQPAFRISINVTAADLGDPEFLPMLEGSLARTGVSAQSLAIEITEGSTVRREVAVEVIGRLRQCGHSVHIDDFGTGYSSLSYLHDLSVDAIKIDRSFTQAIGTGSVVVAILPQILAMAEALNLRVIVEGIETELQAGYFVATSAVETILAQGWLFGRPVAAAEFKRLLAENGNKRPVGGGASSQIVASEPVLSA
jgi:sensor c-di-GMP phosphodiesterase-like protein